MCAANNLIAGSLIALTLTGCGLYDATHDQVVEDEPPGCVGEPGKPGAPGGDGGNITVRYLRVEGPVNQLVAGLQVNGGQGGLRGLHGEPRPLSIPLQTQEQDRGPEGRAGGVAVYQVPELQVDLDDIQPDDALFVSAGELYLKTKTIGPGPLRVRKMVVAPNVSLELSGGWIIEAEQIVISPGASIVVTDRGDRSKNVMGSTVGHAGGSLVLRASKLELYGDIVASGRAGEQGQPGHPGGEVLLEAEQLVIGNSFLVDAGGGAGGQGGPGASCR
jgi:hypothetical protein